MNKKLVIIGIVALIVIAVGLFFYLNGFRFFHWQRGDLGRPFGDGLDNNAFFDRTREALELPVDATREQVMEALGLPGDATQQQVMEALMQKGIDFRRN